MSCTAKVKTFNAMTGFGFLSKDDDSPDVFVHRNDIVDGQSIVEGDTVQFDEVSKGGKRLKAENVTGGTGGPLEEAGAGDGKGKGGKGGKGKGYDGGKGDFMMGK